MIQVVQTDKSFHNTWGDKESFDNAMASMNAGIKASCPILRAEGSYYNYSFRDIAPNTSARTPFSRDNYNHFRPNEMVPTEYKDIVNFCTNVYKKEPIVRQIIDLMGDFSTKGIRLVHQNPETQKYYEAWWEKIRGKHVSERFANNLLRVAVVYVRRSSVKLTAAQQEKYYMSVADDMEVDYVKPTKNEIPLKYTFYCPLTIDNISGALGTFVGRSQYALNIPQELINKIKYPKEYDRELVALLPDDVKRAALNGGKLIIPQDKIAVFHYKKDDWEQWAYPMIYPILNDIILLQKMKLADQAALDGIISKVRVWKLGSLAEKIVPGPDAINKFGEFLLNNVGGGAMDIVWGPAIELLETASTEIDKVLGEEKYIPILNSIYSGLGVPPTLTGSPIPGGFTNNSTSLKTLIERLQYVRDTLVEFWNNEIKIVQQAKGFRFPAQIQFDKTILTDESAEKALLIQLADRNVISYESLRERFGEIPELETRRIKNEMNKRNKGSMPEQTGAFANLDSELKKIALQNDLATPSEVGVVLEESKPEEKSLQTKRYQKFKTPKPAAGTAINIGKPKGRSGQGRPQGKKDSKKRVVKKVKPIRGVANLITWASGAQKKISDILTPIFLEVFNKRNARMLTEAQTVEIENIKFNVLAKYEPNEEITKEGIMEKVDNKIDSSLLNILEASIKNFIETNNREPNLDELRDLQMSSYVVRCINKEGDNNGEDSM